MKKAEDYCEMYFSNKVTLLVKLIKLVQTDAIKEAAENAKTKDIVERENPMSVHQIIDKQSIIKLKK